MELELGGIFLSNTSFDYEEYDYKEEGEQDPAAVFLPFLCSLTLIIGVPGLALLLTLLVRKRRPWSVMDIFALHLAVADVLMLGTLPFWAAQAVRPSGWTFGTPFCKMSGAVFHINFFCGIFLLVCMSLDRYLSIFRSTHFFSRKKPWMVQACCLSVWLLSLLLSIPDWVFLEEVQVLGVRLECVHHYPLLASRSGVDWRLASRLLHHVVGFILPSAVLIFCCSCFLLRLWRGPCLDLQNQRALRLLLGLVGLFLFCWAPYNLTLLAHTVRGTEQRPEPEGGDKGGADGKPTSALGKGLLLMFALGCFHACLQPLLYFGLCNNVRRAVLETLYCVPPVEKANSSHTLWEFGLEEEPLPQQNQEEVVPLNKNQEEETTQNQNQEEKAAQNQNQEEVVPLNKNQGEETTQNQKQEEKEAQNQKQEEVVPLNKNQEEAAQTETRATEQQIPEEEVALNQNQEEESALTQARAAEQQDHQANADHDEVDGRA